MMGEQDQKARSDFKEAAPDYIGLFCKRLPELDRSKNLYEKFRDFCEMVYCTLAQRAPPFNPEKAEKLEARYLQIVDTYQDKDTVRAYPEMLAWAAMAIGEKQEFFGAVSSRMGLLDTTQNSQFFTPHNISTMIADMVIRDCGPIIEKNGFITVAEPASGAGGMILAVADILDELGYDPSFHMLVQATDISPLCYHMTYIQLALRGIPAAVIRGNTLSMEEFESAWTPQIGPFYEKHGRLFEPPYPSGSSESQVNTDPEPINPVDEHGQLGLNFL